MRRPVQRGWVLAAALGLLALALLWWLGLDESPANSSAAVTPVSTSAAPSAAAASAGSMAWALLNQASSQADAASETLIVDAAELQRRDEADCARLAPVIKQLEAGEDSDKSIYDLQDGAREHRAWLRRWILALQQRGDERSLAVVDFLSPMLAPDQMDKWGEAAQRLHQRALRSGDGFVQALAAQRQCLPGLGCSPSVPADRWVQLEPGNLSAWLAMAPSSQVLEPAWVDGVMRVTYDNNHRAELMALLSSLPPQLPPGPRRLSRDLALIGINAGLEIGPSIRPLMQHCKGGADAQRCRALAEKLWALREPTLINWSLTLALARLSPPIDPAWESRAREAEAARQWAVNDTRGLSGEYILHAFQCKPDPVFERQMQGRLIDGEGRMLLAEIKHRGDDIESLAAEFRKKNGRSLLEPLRDPRPASGVQR